MISFNLVSKLIKFSVAKCWWILADFSIFNVKLLRRNGNIFVELGRPSFVMYFDEIFIEIDNVCLEPFASCIFNVKSLVKLERLSSLPLLDDSVSLTISVNPFIILSAPPSKVYFNHILFFLAKRYIISNLTYVYNFSVAPFSNRVQAVNTIMKELSYIMITTRY